MRHKPWSIQKLAIAALTALTSVALLAPARAQGRPEVLWMRGTYDKLHPYNEPWPVTFSPNGAFILGAEASTGMLKVFRVSDGTLVRTIPHRMPEVRRIAVSPDNTRFALGNNNQVRVYRYSDGALLYTINTGSLGLAFTADSAFVVTASGSTILFWNVSNGSQAFSLSASANVSDLTLSPDGLLCAAACADSRVRVWRLSDRSLRYTLTVPATARSITFAPDSTRLSAYTGQSIRIWRTSDGGVLRDINTQAQIYEYDRVSNLTFVQNGAQIAIGHSPAGGSTRGESYYRRIHFYDVNTGNYLRTLDDGWGTSDVLIASPGGSLLLIAGSEIWEGLVCIPGGREAFYTTFSSDNLVLWRVADLQRLLYMSYGDIAAVAVSPNGDRVAYSSGSYRAADGGYISWFGIGENGVFSNDGRLIVATRNSYFCEYTPNYYYESTPIGSISVRRVADDSEVLYSLYGRVFSVSFSPDASHIAVSGYTREWFQDEWSYYWYLALRNVVDIWRLSDGALVRRIETSAQQVAYSPDGATLALASGRVVVFRRVSDGAEIGRTADHSDTITSIAFSPDGSLLAAGCRDGSVRLWRVSNRTLVRTHQQPLPDVAQHRVAVVAFSRDGEILATGGADLRFWRVSNGALERVYDEEVGTGIRSISFADGLFAYSRWDNVAVVARYTGRRIRLTVPASIR